MAFTPRRKKGRLNIRGRDGSDETPLGWRTPWKKKYLQQPSPELTNQPITTDNQNLIVRSLGGYSALQKNRAETGETGSGLSASLTNVISLMSQVWGISTSPGSNRSSEGSVHAKWTPKNFLFLTCMSVSTKRHFLTLHLFEHFGTAYKNVSAYPPVISRLISVSNTF